jgi:hypothetical protein
MITHLPHQFKPKTIERFMTNIFSATALTALTAEREAYPRD